ncbi:uncharacterized protein N7469_000167 [Penicillium citrinum]|uniref:Uncharacterized protein n=1 Tax=Penicillium citrinum TaxID=5077 RepID=A0A9W9TWA2_PENCI|nr:uncharacterized protein N7469_000167 [Penicillium citrinum]KAJ5241840.1 hypothetical protein N7469_000167 [Penicillium citrinum]
MPRRRGTRNSPEDINASSGQASKSHYSSEPSSSTTQSYETPATSAPSSRGNNSGPGEKRKRGTETSDLESSKHEYGTKKEKSLARVSPWDKTERHRVNVEDLDLDVSYEEFVDLEPEPEPELPARQERWQHHGSEPLIDIDSLPADWNTREPDLDPNDIDGQIVRCKERIVDNIMPHFFQLRLKDYQKKKDALVLRDKHEPKGLDDRVYKRIKTLKQTRAHLVEHGDENHQIQNIDKILDAYRSRKIKWTGLVTYWSEGVQLCEPRPFHWDEFEAINAAHSGQSAFWVEGFFGPGMGHSYGSITIPPDPRYQWVYMYNLAVRIPGYQWWTELQFVYDTGSSIMIFNAECIDRMMGPYHPGIAGIPEPALPCMGHVGLITAMGGVNRPVYEIEACLLNDAGNRRLTNWIRVPVCLAGIGGSPPCDTPLDGPFLNYLMFVGCVPNGTGEFVVSTSKTKFNLTSSLPENKREVPPALRAYENLGKVPRGTVYHTQKHIGQLGKQATLKKAPKRIPPKE